MQVVLSAIFRTFGNVLDPSGQIQEEGFFMEKKLKQLFDFQKFSGNAELQSVIDSVHSRYETRELNMDEMDMVFAAGVPHLPDRKNPKTEKKNV